MDSDISPILKDWDYESGQVMARRITGSDGEEKIQLRVDLGLLQMNVNGRPDGRRPNGADSLYDHFQDKLREHITKHGDESEFSLSSDDCASLQQETIQYHHRYICLLQLEDYERVIRDTKRNLRVFEFVENYAETPDLVWALNQLRPQLEMMRIRAEGESLLREKLHTEAIKVVEEGVQKIEDFFRRYERPEMLEQSDELQSLDQWLEELRESRPVSDKEKLERAMAEAVEREDYEKAAEMRDAIRALDNPVSN